MRSKVCLESVSLRRKSSASLVSPKNQFNDIFVTARLTILPLTYLQLHWQNPALWRDTLQYSVDSCDADVFWEQDLAFPGPPNVSRLRHCVGPPWIDILLFKNSNTIIYRNVYLAQHQTNASLFNVKTPKKLMNITICCLPWKTPSTNNGLIIDYVCFLAKIVYVRVIS